MEYTRTTFERHGGLLATAKNAAASDPDAYDAWLTYCRRYEWIDSQLAVLLSEKLGFVGKPHDRHYRDVLALLLGVDIYAELVLRRGWSSGHWADWVRQALRREVLGL